MRLRLQGDSVTDGRRSGRLYQACYQLWLEANQTQVCLREANFRFLGRISLGSESHGDAEYICGRGAEMRSDWVGRLNSVRVWLFGAAVIVAGLFVLLRR